MATTNSGIIHQWANGLKMSGRTGNLKISGPELWSYATPIAFRFPAPDGSHVAVLASNYFSPTTSRHLSIAYHGTRHHLQIRIPHYYRLFAYTEDIMEEKGTKGLAQMVLDRMVDEIEKMQELIYDLRASLKKRDLIEDWQAEREKALKLAELFGLEVDLHGPELFSRELDECPMRVAYKPQQYSRENALADFRAGKGRFGYIGNPTPLRVYKGEVQTGQNVRISADEAARVFCILQRVRRTLTLPEGLKIGPFTVLSVDENILEVGCHQIEWQEIDNVAEELKLTSEKAA